MSEQSSGPSSSQGDGDTLGNTPPMPPEEKPKRGVLSRCYQWTCLLGPALFGVVLAVAGYEMMRSNFLIAGRLVGYDPYDAIMAIDDVDVTEEAKMMFMGYDQDLDGYLSIGEFMDIYSQLTGVDSPKAFAVNTQCS